MNANHKLSEKTFGPRHVQPHMPKEYATKKKKKCGGAKTVYEWANKDAFR